MKSYVKTYLEYQQTGLPWASCIPAHWTLERLKYLVQERVTKGFPDEPLLTATQSRGVIPKADYGTRTVEAQKDLHLLKLVEPGDYVISLRSFQGGIEFAHHRGIISPAYTVLRPRQDVTRSYFEYFFKSADFIRSMTLFVTGIREGQNIDYLRLSRAYMPLPPLEEQEAIGRFVRAIDQRVHRLLQTKRRLITLLNEQKQAIIHQAVTRGLDPDVRLKASGIEGIGDVPEHWQIMLNQRLFRETTRPYLGAEETQLSLSQRDGLIPTANMQERSLQTASYDKWKIVLPEDLVLNRFKAHLGVFFAARLQGIVTFHYGVFAAKKPLSMRYYEHLFHTEAYKAIHGGQSNGMTIGLQNLSNQNFYNVHTIYPPMKEQEEILKFLDVELASLNEATSKTNAEIELIREYRTRLVSEVVTGQLDVRGVALPELAGGADDGGESADADDTGEAADGERDGEDAGGDAAE